VNGERDRSRQGRWHHGYDWSARRVSSNDR
jgi:hypothetical protein